MKGRFILAGALASLACFVLAARVQPALGQNDEARLEGRRQACRRAFEAKFGSCPTSSQNCSSQCNDAQRGQNSRAFPACVYQCYVGCGFTDPPPTGDPCYLE